MCDCMLKHCSNEERGELCHLGVAEGGDVQVSGEGNAASDLAQAAPHVLLEALQVQRQHLWRPV